MIALDSSFLGSDVQDEAVTPVAAMEAPGIAVTDAARRPSEKDSKGTRLAFLRHHTRVDHATIETAPALAMLMSSALTMALYRAVLEAMLKFHVAIEPAIASALEDMPEAASLLDGSRPRALREDVAWFGGAPRMPLPLVLPKLVDSQHERSGHSPYDAVSPAIPSFNCPSEALGALYVIEGAGLGGRIIARHIEAHLAVSPGAGANFYGGHSADDVRQRWARLCTCLEACFADESAVNAHGSIELAMLSGARNSFACLERWLRAVRIATPAAARPAA